MPNKKLIAKLKDKSARVGIIGLGYVGLPLLLRFLEEGFKVMGFDVDPSKVASLKRGDSYIKDIDGGSIKAHVAGGSFEPTTDMSGLADMDAIIICVPTPLKAGREPDMSYVVGTAREIARHLRPGTLVSLESTTYPGTTEELLLPILEKEKTGFSVGKDFFLVFSPERQDPGRKDYTTKTIPKVVGGVTPGCLEAGSVLYSSVIDRVVAVSSTRCAEMTKLLENIYRAVNIALVNELKMLSDRMGIDIWEVIDASETKPFGFQAFRPGPGLGGHCIPIDPFYLTWKAKQFGFSTRFIELAGRINTTMPEYVVEKVEAALEGSGKPLKGSGVLVLGVAYKKDVDDMRESPAVRIIELLNDRGAVVDYNDPYIEKIPELRGHSLKMESVELNESTIKKYDCVVIVTDHSSYDYGWIVEKSPLVVDTRGATRSVKSEKVVMA